VNSRASFQCDLAVASDVITLRFNHIDQRANRITRDTVVIGGVFLQKMSMED
jgi:hypothetical protein